MKKSTAAKESQRTVNDLDITLILRSSKLKTKDLTQLYRRLIDILSSEDLVLLTVEVDSSVNQNADRNLTTLTVKLQSEN